MRSLFFRRCRGGDAVKLIVQEGLFDPYHATREYEEQALPKGKHGAVVTFVGTMRDFNDGHNVSSMFLEHYPGMTERHIEAVCQEAADKWDVIDAFVLHRHGEISISAPTPSMPAVTSSTISKSARRFGSANPPHKANAGWNTIPKIPASTRMG